MAKHRGLPKDLNLLDGVKKPERPRPIRGGDYLDEIEGLSPRMVATPAPTAHVESETIVSPSVVETETTAGGTNRASKKKAGAARRNRPNLNPENQRQLDAVVAKMVSLGPEGSLHGGEVIGGLIQALYDARDHFDLSHVRRRGKYGTQAHQNFKAALAECVRRAIADHSRE